MILSDLQLSQMLMVAGIFGLAAMVQAVTGFGFALLVVPLLAVAVSPVPAVVATTALSLVVSGAIAGVDRDLGNRAFHLLAAATFRRLVLLMMIASALVALGSALAG